MFLPEKPVHTKMTLLLFLYKITDIGKGIDHMLDSVLLRHASSIANFLTNQRTNLLQFRDSNSAREMQPLEARMAW
jgi:hypothetical protein